MGHDALVIELLNERLADLKERIGSLERMVTHLVEENADQRQLLKGHMVAEQRLMNQLEETKRLQAPKHYRVAAVYPTGKA